jgi:hypothetical protein
MDRRREVVRSLETAVYDQFRSRQPNKSILGNATVNKSTPTLGTHTALFPKMILWGAYYDGDLSEHFGGGGEDAVEQPRVCRCSVSPGRNQI